MLKLFDYFRSSASFRVRIALNIKQLDYETIPVHLLNNGGEQFSESYQKINPQQLVPAFQDGNKILTQSLAIIEYLDEIHPVPALLPSDPFVKALARSFALSIAADIHPIINMRVQKYLMDTLNTSEEQKKQWYRHWTELGLNALEKQLTKHKLSDDYCFGNEMTIADLCLVPQMFNARRFECNLNGCPTLVRIDANCQTHQAVIKAWPKEVVT